MGERTGWLDAGYYLMPARKDGLEHRFWFDEASGRVIKLTLLGPCRKGELARVQRVVKLN